MGTSASTEDFGAAALATAVKTGEVALTTLFHLFQTAQDRFNKGLPTYIKRSTVDSRVFISKEAAMEECINDVLYADNALYVSWVSTAMAMNQMVGKTRVRDMLSVVATEHLSPSSYTVPLETAVESINTANSLATPPCLYGETVKQTASDIENTLNGERDPIIRGPGGSKIQNPPTDFNLLSGIVVEISFAINEKQTVTLPVLVRLTPSLIKDDVAQAFFKANYKPDFWMRWFKVRTGEISFWRDFLLELDLRDDREKVLRNDKDGALHDMLLQQKNSLASYVGKILGWRSERQNLASAIHVYTKRQFDAWCHSLHLNFDRPDDRMKFFKRTFSVIVNVIDSDFNRVTVYAAGINNKAEYSFSQLQNNRNKQQYDLVQIMRAFSSQAAARF